jgi:hypothetical protein
MVTFSKTFALEQNSLLNQEPAHMHIQKVLFLFLTGAVLELFSCKTRVDCPAYSKNNNVKKEIRA